MAIIIGILAARNYSGSTLKQLRGLKHITMEHVFNGTFGVERKSLRWVPEGEPFYDLIVLHYYLHRSQCCVSADSR